MNDNDWHSVKVMRRGKNLKLMVDDDVAEGTNSVESFQNSFSATAPCNASIQHLIITLPRPPTLLSQVK